MRYPVVRNRFLRCYLFLWDVIYFVCSKCFPSKDIAFSDSSLTNHCKRILLRNPAALGDVLYTLRIAATLKKNYPDIEIGVLVGSWAKGLVTLSPDISYVHFEDHWAVTRSRKHILYRFWNWLCARPHLLKDIREKHYDLAVDLYYYFPSSTCLFWQAGIPSRVGYDSNGGDALLTHVLHWQILNQHNIEYQAALLESIGFSMKGLQKSKINIRFLDSDDALLAQYGLVGRKYVVLHMGTGEKIKEWDLRRWKKLAISLVNRGYTICFTGQGKHEEELIQEVTECLPVPWMSLCNKLSLREFFQIIKNAVALIGVDSFANHIAAMYQMPQIAIMHGAANQYHWQPYSNPNCKVLRRKMDCSPCYFTKLCQRNNECMDIPLEDVLHAVNDLFHISCSAEMTLSPNKEV